MNLTIYWLTIALRLLLATLLGGIIGYQREVTDRPAGFRTHVMVSVGSALFMLVSAYDFGQPTDPTRIAAQVVTGIGFLGAGTIIRQGNIVIGLTTAASLWAVSAVGLAAGAGFYSGALLGTITIYLALTVFKSIESRLVGGREHRVVHLTIDGPDKVAVVEELLKSKNIEVENIERNMIEKGKIYMRLALSLPGDYPAELLFNELTLVGGVQGVRWEF